MNDPAGITIISRAADTLNPIVTPKGGAAAEVPKLVAFVSKQTGAVGVTVNVSDFPPEKFQILGLTPAQTGALQAALKL